MKTTLAERIEGDRILYKCVAVEGLELSDEQVRKALDRDPAFHRRQALPHIVKAEQDTRVERARADTSDEQRIAAEAQAAKEQARAEEEERAKLAAKAQAAALQLELDAAGAASTKQRSAAGKKSAEARADLAAEKAVKAWKLAEGEGWPQRWLTDEDLERLGGAKKDADGAQPGVKVWNLHKGEYETVPISVATFRNALDNCLQRYGKVGLIFQRADLMGWRNGKPLSRDELKTIGAAVGVEWRVAQSVLKKGRPASSHICGHGR